MSRPVGVTNFAERQIVIAINNNIVVQRPFSSNGNEHTVKGQTLNSTNI